MTAKEKAEELYSKMQLTQGYKDWGQAKSCALIAVDEIIDIVCCIYSYDSDVLCPYWQEVKQEIEKL